MKIRPHHLAVLSLVVLLIVPAVQAQDGAKVPLTHDVYDSWRSISGEKLSDDGAWLLYAEVPQKADAELVVRNLRDAREYRTALGWLNPTGSFPRVQAEFAADGEHVVFLASPAMAQVKAARKDKTKPDEMPKNSLGILRLADGSVANVERVKSFALPEDAGAHVAYLLEKPLPEKKQEGEAEEQSAATEPPAPEPEPQPAPEPEPEPEPQAEPAEDEEDDKSKDKDYGTELVIRSLADGSESSIAAALSMTFTDAGERLFYIVSSEDEPATDGVYAVDTGAGTTHALVTGEANYKHLAFNEAQTRAAFLSDVNDYAADEPVFELFGMAIDATAATLWVSHASTAGFPAGMAVSDKESISFTDDAAMVMFGIKERPEPKVDDEDADAPEKAKFDLWHWNDPFPQPQQLLMANEVKDEAYESVWHIDAGRFVQLADADLPDVTLADNGSVAMGSTRMAWAARHSYEGFFSDVWLVDPVSGERTLVVQQLSGGARLSPDGGYVAWYGGDGEWIGYDRNGGGGWSGGQHWFLYDVASGEKRNLTAGLDASFELADWDTPTLAPAYGTPGFVDNDAALLVYDQYDVWAFPTDGSEPRRITEGVGREQNTSFRALRLDPDADALPASAPMVMLGTNQNTMATGFWVDSVAGDSPPTRMLAAEAALTFRDLADAADTFLFTRQTFSEYPDLWVGALQLGGDRSADADSDAALTDVRKVSDLGVQTDAYIWGQAELVDFHSADGLPLKGILIKPENFDPDKQYPLMVYIYETLHQGVHRFRNPSPGSSVNPSYYVSNGYVLWMPDIEYVTPGYPGKDAMKCVLPGINMLVRDGSIDADAIGIQGHSWGGYQISYMITQTDVFAAAEAGAPVSNMTSAYGGIRWGSGLVRQFQYERTQSRLGASLWEVPLRYIENSPLFWADNIETPLMYMHNDEDGAVPWYQGIELIMAMRRLGKEAYMFNYNGEAHGLRQRVNQEDWTVRMAQFFDHHLKGEPAPDWMTQGIKGWEKGEVTR